MSNSSREVNMQELLKRLAELERVNSRIVEELKVLRAEQLPPTQQVSSHAVMGQHDAIEKQSEFHSAEETFPQASTRAVPQDDNVNQEGPTRFTGDGAFTTVVSIEATTHAQGMFVLNDDIEVGVAISPGAIGNIAGPVGVGAVNLSGIAITGQSTSSEAIRGISRDKEGIVGQSSKGIGVHGIGGGAQRTLTGLGNAGVFAEGGTGFGVLGVSDSSVGVAGNSNSGIGVNGSSKSSFGIAGQSDDSVGVVGSSLKMSGVAGFSQNFFGVVGQSTSGGGVAGVSTSGPGVAAASGLGPALLVVGLLQIQGDAVGQALLLAGQQSVTVNTIAATPTSNILLTPLNNPQGQLWVTQAAGSFTIHANASPTSDVPISYLIIN